MATNPAFLDEIIDFMMIENKTLEQILSFHASESLQTRVEELIAKDHEKTITEEEQIELQNHMQLDHLMILMKARAAKSLASRAA